MNEHVTSGLPMSLVSVLRDQSVIVRQDAAVFELIAAWSQAPTNTATTEIGDAPYATLMNVLYAQTRIQSSTTPAAASA
jgi:hypothetical protein